MRNITEQCPKMKNHVAQHNAEKGFTAGKAGKPLKALEDEGFSPWDPGARAAWICGWEFAGGDIMRKIVVTQRQRWEEERAKLVERLAWLDSQLAANP